MKALRGLERQGYHIVLNGDRIRMEIKTGFSPDVGTVDDLIRKIKDNKADAVWFLKERREPVWCKGFDPPRWVSWDACIWHREVNDPHCQGCRPWMNLRGRGKKNE